MDDGRLRTELERLVPEPRGARGWEDVLRRAVRIRRRRRRRLALVSVVVLLPALAAALGAAGQLSGLLSHTAEPHLVVRGDLVRADGAHMGAIEIELSRAAIAVDGHRHLRLWGRSQDGTSFPARWFLDRGRGDAGRLDGALYLRRPGRRLLVLCSDCGTRASGRLSLRYAQASALVNGRLVFVLGRGAGRLASARLVLDRAHLRRGLRCSRITPPRGCNRIYTGR